MNHNVEYRNNHLFKHGDLGAPDLVVDYPTNNANASVLDYGFARRPLLSLWKKLPQVCIDLIFAYDMTYRDYLNHHILYTRPLYRFPCQAAQLSPFYQAITLQKYRNSKNNQGDILQLLHLQSIYTNNPVYPLAHELKCVNYSRQKFTHCKIHKHIFYFQGFMHWYIVLDETKIDIVSLTKKLLFINDNIRMYGDSSLEIFHSISSHFPKAVYDYTNYEDCLNNLTSKVQKIHLKAFCIKKNHKLGWIRQYYDQITLLSFNNKLFIEYEPEGQPDDSEDDDSVNDDMFYEHARFNFLVYFINYSLKSVCCL